MIKVEALQENAIVNQVADELRQKPKTYLIKITTSDQIYHKSIPAEWIDGTLYALEDLIIPINTDCELLKIEVYLKHRLTGQ